MSATVRNSLAALLAAFMIGIVAGGAGLLSGNSGAQGSIVGEARPEVATATATGTPSPKPKPKRLLRALTAQAVHEGGGRITISGVMRSAKSGTRLTVQRREAGGWTDFPAGSTVGADGRYSLWLQTGRTGTMTFRMIDADSGQTSNSVQVDV